MSHVDEHEEDGRQRLDLHLWRRILGHAAPFRPHLIGLGLSGMGMAAADVSVPLVTGWIIDDATGGGDRSLLWRHVGVYAFVVVAISVMILSFIRLAGRVATGYAHEVRRAGFARLQELSFSFYDVQPVGWLMARMTSDTSKLASVIPWTILDAVWGSSMVVGISTMMLVLDVRLALLVMVIIPPLALVSVVFQRRLLDSQRAVRRTNSRITASFNEGIMGVRTTKALVREQANLREFQELSGSMYAHSMRNALHAAVYLPLVVTLGSVGVGLALWQGGVGIVNLGGSELTLGELVAFMQYAALFAIPIQDMAERFTQLQAAQASAERLQLLLDTEPEIKDSDAVREAMARARRAGHDGAIDGGPDRIEEVCFEKVSFAYKPGEWVLRGFDLTVRAGESIALVGPTGSGKSTIASLLGRFYEPTEGSIRFNGVDYRDRSLEWLQSNLGIVLQVPHLFSGSIRENIRYGRLEATDAEVEAAARLVNAHDFVTSLESGYDTEVGEGGSRLSTGQRQLLSLARAVLANPQVFIMDEATSSVDTETERLIQDAIESVLTGRISVIIAHRLSTIRRADRILVIDRGRMIESGSHAELLALGGRYHALYTNQFAEEQRKAVIEGCAPIGTRPEPIPRKGDHHREGYGVEVSSTNRNPTTSADVST
jgi:ATP-binding cassette subfamily B protein